MVNHQKSDLIKPEAISALLALLKAKLVGEISLVEFNQGVEAINRHYDLEVPVF